MDEFSAEEKFVLLELQQDMSFVLLAHFLGLGLQPSEIVKLMDDVCDATYH